MILKLSFRHRIEFLYNFLKIYKYTIILCLIFVSSVFQSCGFPSIKKKADAGLSKETRIIDPFEFGDEFFLKSDSALKDDMKKSGSVPVIKIPPQTASKKRETGNSITEPDLSGKDTGDDEYSAERSLGFRIQIGVFDDKENARNSADIASAKFKLPVYVEYKAPFFRVMLGDFKTSEEAEKYIEFVKNEGFGDARWVPSNINSKQ